MHFEGLDLNNSSVRIGVGSSSNSSSSSSIYNNRKPDGAIPK
jgi:hypothetical protein